MTLSVFHLSTQLTLYTDKFAVSDAKSEPLAMEIVRGYVSE